MTTMTLADIVAADHAKNHSGRAYSAQDAAKSLADRLAAGKPIFNRGPVAITFDPAEGGGVEFHCINGGTGRDLALAVNQFLADMASQYAWAVTFYDNPAVSALALKYADFPASIEQIDAGPDRTFKAVFNLRSA